MELTKIRKQKLNGSRVQVYRVERTGREVVEAVDHRSGVKTVMGVDAAKHNKSAISAYPFTPEVERCVVENCYERPFDVQTEEEQLATARKLLWAVVRRLAETDLGSKRRKY